MEYDSVKIVIRVPAFAGLFVHIESVRSDLRYDIRHDEFFHYVFAVCNGIKFFCNRAIKNFGLVGVTKNTFRAQTVFFGKRSVNLTVALPDYVYFF